MRCLDERQQHTYGSQIKLGGKIDSTPVKKKKKKKDINVL